MPSTGTPSSSSSVRSSGAPSEYTDAGPPDNTRAAGCRSRMRARSVSNGRSSANTPHSRILLAISWEYCPPKSRTSTSSVIRDGYPRGNRRPAVGPHANRLLALELLALCLESRGHHHLGTLEVADVLVAAGRHRRAQRPHQVERAVVLQRRAEEDLLQGPVLGGCHSGAPRQGRMEGRHAPVKAAAGGLLGPRQRGADHDRVGA